MGSVAKEFCNKPQLLVSRYSSMRDTTLRLNFTAGR